MYVILEHIQINHRLHRIHNTLLQRDILPLGPLSLGQYIQTDTHIPASRVHPLGQLSFRRTSRNSLPQAWKVLPDNINHQLRSNQPRNEQDALTTGCGGCQRIDVAMCYVPHVNLKELANIKPSGSSGVQNDKTGTAHPRPCYSSRQ